MIDLLSITPENVHNLQEKELMRFLLLNLFNYEEWISPGEKEYIGKYPMFCFWREDSVAYIYETFDREFVRYIDPFNNMDDALYFVDPFIEHKWFIRTVMHNLDYHTEASLDGKNFFIKTLPSSTRYRCIMEMSILALKYVTYNKV